jgi:hypothetical protein
MATQSTIKSSTNQLKTWPYQWVLVHPKKKITINVIAQDILIHKSVYPENVINTIKRAKVVVLDLPKTFAQGFSRELVNKHVINKNKELLLALLNKDTTYFDKIMPQDTADREIIIAFFKQLLLEFPSDSIAYQIYLTQKQREKIQVLVDIVKDVLKLDVTLKTLSLLACVLISRLLASEKNSPNYAESLLNESLNLNTQCVTLDTQEPQLYFVEYVMHTQTVTKTVGFVRIHPITGQDFIAFTQEKEDAEDIQSNLDEKEIFNSLKETLCEIAPFDYTESYDYLTAQTTEKIAMNYFIDQKMPKPIEIVEGTAQHPAQIAKKLKTTVSETILKHDDVTVIVNIDNAAALLFYLQQQGFDEQESNAL